MTGSLRVAPELSPEPGSSKAPSRSPFPFPGQSRHGPSTDLEVDYDEAWLPLNACCGPWSAVKAFLACCFFPLRLFTFMLTALLFVLIMRIASLGCTISPFVPLARWRRSLIRGSSVAFARTALFCLGCWPGLLRYKLAPGARRLAPHEMPRIIVANHVSYIDALLVLYFWSCGGVAKIELGRAPLIGFVIRSFQSIFVDRSNAEARHQVMEDLKKRALSPDDLPPIVIFPEGTTTTGRKLLRFNRGAFAPGVRVLPVVIRYPYRNLNVAWWGVAGHWHLLRLFLSWGTRVEVLQLAPYTPTDAEKSDVDHFATNVRQAMAAASGLGLMDAAYRECIDREIAFQRMYGSCGALMRPPQPRPAPPPAAAKPPPGPVAPAPVFRLDTPGQTPVPATGPTEQGAPLPATPTGPSEGDAPLPVPVPPTRPSERNSPLPPIRMLPAVPP